MTGHEIAFYSVTVITLLGACWLMSKVPNCDHPSCRDFCRENAAKELRAARHGEIERLHAYHDRFRPQRGCPLCALVPRDDPEDET